MTTKIKYNLVPHDGSLAVANRFIDKIIAQAPKNIDELQIEVQDLYTIKSSSKFNIVQKSLNGVEHSNIKIQ